MKLYEQLKQKLLGKDPLIDILGQEHAKLQIKSALLVNRHIIILGSPGMGKTTMAKNIARLLPETIVNDCPYNCDPQLPLCPYCKREKPKAKKIVGEKRFIRLQGSPDLTAEDLLGDIDPIKALKYGPLSPEAFTPGKIFKANNGILFFDELNRCPEKLQNALLQVLEEGTITLGTYDMDFNVNFIFIGTMNPYDSSTERMADVLLDRFDVVTMTYPENTAIEQQIVMKKGKKLMVEFPESLLHYALQFIHDVRHNEHLEKYPSVRASLGLYERSQSNALLHGRKKVTLDDLQQVMESVLAHRIKLKPSMKYLKDPSTFVREEFIDYVEKNPHLATHEAFEKSSEEPSDGL